MLLHIRGLFLHFCNNPKRLPQHVQLRFASDGEVRAVSDYVAGMTDRFALDQHEKLAAGASRPDLVRPEDA